jgi:hypothetical protein
MEKHTHTGLIICLGRGPSRPRLLDKKQTHTIQETTVASDSVSIHEGATPLAPPTAPRLYSRTAANLPTPPHPRRHAPRGREGSKTQAAGVIVSRHTPAATRRGGGGEGGAALPRPGASEVYPTCDNNFFGYFDAWCLPILWVPNCWIWRCYTL